ncbi:MAG: helical backbone metal receptor [Acidobacteriota bacterium]
MMAKSTRLVLASLLLVGAACARQESTSAPAPGLRIVVMAPSAAEMLGALGLSEQVVGIGDFVSEPRQLAKLPRIGAFDAPNLESVLALHATHFVTARQVAGSASLAKLRALGIQVIELDTSTFDGTLLAMKSLGAELGAGDRAAALVHTIENQVAEVRRRSLGALRKRVLFAVGREPLYVAGPGSHIDALIRAAGGENIAADATSPYPQVSLEAMLARRPEVILDSADNRPGLPLGRELGAWAQWPFLPAVAERRVYALDPACISVPGPRLGEMAQLMAKLVHPEIFGEATAEELGPPREASPVTR